MLTISDILTGLSLTALFLFACFLYGAVEYVLQRWDESDPTSGDFSIGATLRSFFSTFDSTNTRYFACLTPVVLSVTCSFCLTVSKASYEFKFTVLSIGVLLCVLSGIVAMNLNIKVFPTFFASCVTALIYSLMVLWCSYVTEGFTILAVNCIMLFILLFTSQAQIVSTILNHDFRNTLVTHIHSD